jgi:hypothetical protein
MEEKPFINRLATISLSMGIVGWFIYILQWCLDLTLGILMAVASAGSSAICSSILDFLPLGFWLTGVVTGHMALGQTRQAGTNGRKRAVLGLVLCYSGMVFTILLLGLFVALLSRFIGRDDLGMILPLFSKP